MKQNTVRPKDKYIIQKLLQKSFIKPEMLAVSYTEALEQANRDLGNKGAEDLAISM